ncbi:MAG: dihydrofolate reductase [Acidobacteria bacterium]|nr:dihydrofolate reductase [Acidobacteriota bacterium]
MIVGIVAISKNGAIGKDGALPWHYPADLKYFKETTTGNTVVMGSTTWRSIGRPLPDRRNVVFTNSKNLVVPEGVIIANDRLDVLKLDTEPWKDIYIIGGAKTYEAFRDLIEKWLVTEIPIDVPDADTFFDLSLLDGFEVRDALEFDDGMTIKSMLPPID